MEGVYNVSGGEVSVIKVFVKSRTVDSTDGTYGYAVDVQCYDVFLTEAIKERIEQLSILVLSYGPEIQIYRYIKDKEAIFEFKASQVLPGSYRINVINSLEEYMSDVDEYGAMITAVSKDLIERIVYLFGAYSIHSY
jgi:hypothetical protein